MERDDGFAERDPVAVAQSRAVDAPIIVEEHVAGAGSQIDEYEFLVGRPLNQCVMAVHGGMFERNVVVAMPPKAQHLAGEHDRRC